MSREPLPPTLKRGAISWMARNAVAANLAMVVLIVGGIIVSRQVKQEVFPEFDLDYVTINVVYPGASPEEVEKGVTLAVEEAVRGLDGIQRVTASSSEGRSYVMAELLLGEDQFQVLNDIKSAVDRLTSFPLDAEEPVVSLLQSRRQVISMVLFGDVDEGSLHQLAEKARDDLLNEDEITQVELSGVRPLEISIEIPQEVLRTYRLTLEAVSRLVAQSAVEIPGGGVRAPTGEVLLRVSERRERGGEFADIPIVTAQDGSAVRLADIAEIRDGYRETDQFARFDGQRAMMVRVFRVGNETPISVADTVKAYVERLRPELPPGISVVTWNDDSRIFRDRIDLLLRNAQMGLILVLFTLGLFLEIRLAFWVTMGIPISFLGAFLLLPGADVSINMISLFAFIVTLGMVVDDAIVIGENIYDQHKRGLSFAKASIVGARELAVPVTFSILTSVVAFSPLLFVSGVSGKLFRNIPIVVISVLLISLFESLFVLPAHLGHLKDVKERGVYAFVHRQQQRVSRALDWFVRVFYGPSARFAVRHRYVTICLGIATLTVAIGYIRGGHIDFTFLPRVEGDIVTASAKLPFGAPVAETDAVQERLASVARELLEEESAKHGNKVYRGVYAQVGTPIAGGGAVNVGMAGQGSHLAGVQIELLPIDERPFTASQFVQRWRARVGEIPGVETLSFTFTTGPSGGSPIDVQLIHSDVEALEEAASLLAAELANFEGVKDIDAGFSSGKPQLDFTVRDEAIAAGLTAQDIARQLRSAFFGAEALRQQRGRDEVRVYVRYPEQERRSEASLDDFMVRTPTGGEIPLVDAADVKRGASYTEIRRADGQRVLNVKADIVEGATSADRVLSALRSGILPQLADLYPGLQFGVEGEQKERNDSLRSLGQGFMIALIVMFALMAIPFRSYVQPLIVMTAIPFGLVGALLGHVLLGFDLSIMSMMGLVALSGVVVNDSLVLVDSANRMRLEGMDSKSAVVAAGQRRFRPILLTSVTTFFGLMPMIFETSVQARFLVPMAISLGFGVMFSTFVILVMVPALYAIVEDARFVFGLPGTEPPEIDMVATAEDLAPDELPELPGVTLVKQ